MSFDFSFPPDLEDLREHANSVAKKGAIEFGRFDDSWINGYSKEFSKVLASEGWIGMTWPTEHGGGGRPGIERIIVAEEMMKAGAPISASWIADRQMGPAIYSYGTQDQKERFLPAMLEGESTWCIGYERTQFRLRFSFTPNFCQKRWGLLHHQWSKDLDKHRCNIRLLLPNSSNS